MAVPNSEELARCVEQIDRDRLTKTLCELIEQPSVNPFGEAPKGAEEGEQRVAAYLRDRLAELGWTCDVDEYAPGRYNALARFPGASAGRALMFAGHMDTVETTGYPQALTGVVRDGRVSRPGGVRHEGRARLLSGGRRGPGRAVDQSRRRSADRGRGR